MARDSDLAALAALIGAGALAMRKKSSVDLGPIPPELKGVNVSGANFRQRLAEIDNPYRKVTPEELRAVRGRVLDTDPAFRGVVRDSDNNPVLSGTGQTVKSGSYKKGGKVKKTASSRGDGIAQRGKTKGKMR
jgi:hypothetical protein